ncbi:MAG: CocE/NonD family hydrolase [Dehalococcoidales bacterium]|nr:CocE/NonD family hydrolase [Dehalococcoidales bacterium]
MERIVDEIVYPNPTPPGVNLEKNVYATMRDGIKIALDIYKPADEKGPWPVILAYSPFPKERIFESAKPGFYCSHGYVCVQASERGSGFNQGRFNLHGTQAAQDGYDLVEWIAGQPWCTGNVGMMGASGYGVMQWLTAPLNPPHLKALVVLATTDNYRGLCYPGGVLRKPFVLNLVSGLTQGAIWPGPISGKEMPMNVIAEILAHTEDGPFWWEHGGGWKRISEIKAPVLNIVNAPNRLHAIYHLRSYADIKSPKKLIVTPWTNENYQPWIFETTAFNMQILRWLDYWLKGVDTGIMDEPEVAIFDNGIGTWRYENEYPLKRTVWTKFYLHDEVINQTQPLANEQPDFYENISLNTAMLASYGIDMPVSPKKNYITYLSSPLEEDIKVCGPVSFTLYASTTEEVTSDWSFFIKMGEMVSEGTPLNPITDQPETKPEVNDRFTPENVQIWSWGSLKAKFREIDERLSRPGSPWHSYQSSQQLEPCTIYEFQIELQPVFKTFRKGCRIWLKIASDDVLYATLDSASRYVETPISPENSQISIYHNVKYPSHILLPVIPDAPEIASVKPPLCDALPGAPRFTE